MVRYSVPQCKNKTYTSLSKKKKKIVKKWIIPCRIEKKLTSNMFVCSLLSTNIDAYRRVLLLLLLLSFGAGMAATTLPVPYGPSTVVAHAREVAGILSF